MISLVSYLGCAVNMLLVLGFTGIIVPRRWGVWSYAATAFTMSLVMLIKVSEGGTSAAAIVINILVIPAYFIVVPLILYQGPWWKRIFVIMYAFAINLVSDAAAISLFCPTLEYEVIYADFWTWMSYWLTCLFLEQILYGISLIVFISITMRKFRSFYLLFLAFPVCLILFTCYAAFDLWDGIMAIALVLGGVCSIILLLQTLSMEKKAALEEELRSVRHSMEMEKAHYLMIEEKREALARIRHDFNNQLAAITNLIQQGESKEAERIANRLSQEIGATREQPYCSIPVINAVVEEKVKEADRQGLKVEIKMEIPENLAVDAIHLCSIFSNLLDNAIEGTGAWKAQHPKEMEKVQEAVIQLSTRVEGDYLFIRTVNPALPSAAQSKMPRTDGHGYGRLILQDIASRYEGDYRTEYKDGIFTAMVAVVFQK